MGVHIIVKKVIEKINVEDYGHTVPFYVTEKQDWFDTIRYSGDSNFIIENEFCFIDTDIVEQELVRPKDFNKCREWVKLKVYESGQQRLLNALDKMELDETICFKWSW